MTQNEHEPFEAGPNAWTPPTKKEEQPIPEGYVYAVGRPGGERDAVLKIAQGGLTERGGKTAVWIDPEGHNAALDPSQRFPEVVTNERTVVYALTDDEGREVAVYLNGGIHGTRHETFSDEEEFREVRARIDDRTVQVGVAGQSQESIAVPLKVLSLEGKAYGGDSEYIVTGTHTPDDLDADGNKRGTFGIYVLPNDGLNAEDITGRPDRRLVTEPDGSCVLQDLRLAGRTSPTEAVNLINGNPGNSNYGTVVGSSTSHANDPDGKGFFPVNGSDGNPIDTRPARPTGIRN